MAFSPLSFTRFQDCPLEYSHLLAPATPWSIFRTRAPDRAESVFLQKSFIPSGCRKFRRENAWSAIKVHNTYVILPLQFMVSFGASFGVAYYIGKGEYTTESIAGICGFVSLVIFAVLYFLHKTIGPLENRTSGTLGQKMQSPHQRGHQHQ